MQAKQALSTALNGFKTAVYETFDLDPAPLLNCLSQMSFAGGSMAGSAALIASQAGIAYLDAAENPPLQCWKAKTSKMAVGLDLGHDRRPGPAIDPALDRAAGAA